MGMSAAAAPFGVIKAETSAPRSMVNTSSRTRLSPACAITCCPAQVVIPAASSPSATTKSAAMRTTVGELKPASDCSRVSTPVAHKARATPRATIPTGIGSRQRPRRRRRGSAA